MTAFNLFQLLADAPHCFFLDSGLVSQKRGRYSFIGSHPFLIFRSKGRSLQLDWGDWIERKSGNPFDMLREILERFQSPAPPKELPFAGGGIGYLGYPLRHFIEELPSITCNDLDLPDCYFAFYDVVVAFDHLSDQVYLCQSHFKETAAARCQTQAKKLRVLLQSTNCDSQFCSGSPCTTSRRDFMHHTSHITKSSIHSNFTKANYLSTVEQAKAYIAAGDIYQINISQRLSTAVNLPPAELYACLRQFSPAPFSAYLHCGDFDLLSVSPERFLRFTPDSRTVETQPIKGTRPRGWTPEIDRKLAAELLHSEKDRAELLMIVDLERNDLGRVCEIGSVRVPELIALESYSNVHHLVATVMGRLRTGRDRVDLLQSCFPGGSITGVPKIRAMALIDALEPTNRGVYTGAIGYLGYDGGMDLNIAIRTCVVKNGVAYFHAGGGIVADSDPVAEYQETLDKAKGWLATLNVKWEA